MALGSSESATHSILFHFVWNEMNRDPNIAAHLSIGTKISGQQNLTGFVELFSLVFVDDLCSHEVIASGGPVMPGPLFEICEPPFHVWSLVAPYIQNRILKMWGPLLVFGPSTWFLAPLLLNPGDGPGSHASYHHCGKVINVRETYFCEKILAGIRVSWVLQNYFNLVPMLESWWVDHRTYFWEKIMAVITFSWAFQKYFNCIPMLQSREMDQKKSNCSCDIFLWKILGDITLSWAFQKYFNFALMLESRNVDHVKSNCSWDMFLWKNSGGLHTFMSLSNIFQLCTHARITTCGSHEK